MCGIAGFYIKKRAIGTLPVDSLATHLLQGIEHRGRHATGVVAVDSHGRITLQKKDIPASRFNRERKPIPHDARTVLLHTRFATQGDPKEFENNHPVIHGTCFVTHNGHIANDDDIVKDLGIGRPAAVDSVVIPMLLYTKGLQETEHIKEALETLRGPVACAAIDPVNCPGKLVLAKGNGNPLWVLNHPKLLAWASTKDALLDAWSAVLGTPPKKEVRWKGDHPEIVEKGGHLYDFKWGDLWIIDDDHIEVDQFKQEYSYRKPKRKDNEYDAGFHGWGPHTPTAASRDAYRPPSEKRNFTHTKTWLCIGISPDGDTKRCFVADEHGCRNCSTLSCKCYESKYEYTDPAPWGEDDPNWTPPASCAVEPVRKVEALIRCDGCLEWFDSEKVEDAHQGSQVLQLCEACWLDDEWDQKSGEIELMHHRSRRERKATKHNHGKPDLRVITNDDEKTKVLQDVKEGVIQLVAEAAEERHKQVCDFIADRHGTNPEFVEYLIFQASDDELQDQEGNLLAMRCTLEEEYAAEMKERSQ